MTAESVQDSREQRARCVVWRARQSPIPPELSIALQRKHFDVVDCDSPYWATAELCRLHAADTQTPVILLAVEPGQLPDFRDVLRVCETYAPQATQWIYDSASKPALRAAGAAAASDKPDPECEAGKDSPSILSGDELASLKHPDQADEPEA